MANFIYNKAKTALAKGALNFDAAGDDWRILLVMTNTTADTEDDTEFIGDFTTLDEMDGSGYVRKALASEIVNEDLPNNRAEFDASDVTWTALGAGTRNVAGAILYKHVTTDADSIPAAYIDDGGFPFTANGGDVTIQWNVEGILQFT